MDKALTPIHPSAPEAAPVWSVRQVNQRAKELLERQFYQIRIEGEISNLKLDRSGHRYFSLKDDSGVISAALFRQRAGRLAFVPADGHKVVATGTVTVYGPQGRYQLMVSHLEEAGAGALQAAFAKLRQRLLQEGLFDGGRKRPLPLLPRRVAVLTSPTGAVWRDIQQVSLRRFAGAPLLLVPVPVQGAGAAQHIVRALEQVGARCRELAVDVVLLARGGGSLEDLWAFNDEALARAIYACPVPVVSAVGHETDTTIADFVADLRAPTPSAAAECIFAERAQLLATVLALKARLLQATRRRLEAARLRHRAAQHRLGDGQRLFWQPTQRLAALERRLADALGRLLRGRRQALLRCERRLQPQHPRQRLAALEQRRLRAVARLVLAARQRLGSRRTQLSTLQAQLVALSPLAVLQRGYAIVQRLPAAGRGPGAPAAAQTVRQVAQAPRGTPLQIRVADGLLLGTSAGPAEAGGEPGPSPANA